MGVFDIPAPLFTALDSLLGGMPAYPRLLIWAALTGAVSMALYWLCSAQEKVGAAKQRAITARKQMAGYEGTEFDEMWPLARESLAASLSHFAIVLGPALLSSLPALAIIVWVSNTFGYNLPEAGDTLVITTEPEKELGAPLTGAADGTFEVYYPADDATVTVSTVDGETITTLPMQAPVPVIHKKLWWNSLIGNANGYLSGDAPVEAIYFVLEEQSFLSFGPGWLQSWWFSYFVLLIVVSLIIKVVFRIH
jgi:uncharacterized membrane protein (DUF106 family)